MSKFSEKELDKVLNQLKKEPAFIRLKDLDGDISRNYLIVNDLEKDGYVKIERMTVDERNYISLTIEGESIKNLGGYSWLAKRQHRKQRRERANNTLYIILGSILTKVIEWLIDKDIPPKTIELLYSIFSE